MEEREESLEVNHIPFIRIKQPHRKSRLGCVTCKLKRVKCDETRPCCNRCRVRGLECTYSKGSAQAFHAGRNGNPTPNSSSSTFVSRTLPATSVICPLPGSSGVDDNELARHYLEHVVETFSRSSTRRESNWVWQIFVPARAYESDTVRHGMLVVSAMCLHFHEAEAVDQSSKYLEAAVAHGNVFVRQSRHQLKELRASDVESNLACTRLLSVLAFAFFRYNRLTGVEFEDSTSWTWLHLLLGVGPTYKCILESGQTVDPMIMQDMIPEVPLERPAYKASLIDSEPGSMHPLLTTIRESRTERIGALHSALDQDWFSLDQQQSKDMLAAIENLSDVTEYICSEEVHSLFRAIVTWPARLSPGFVNMLINCLPSALAVYSHWLMLVVLAEDLWWIGDMGKAGIREIAENHTTHSGLWALTEWPRRILDAF